MDHVDLVVVQATGVDMMEHIIVKIVVIIMIDTEINFFIIFII